MLKLYEDSSSHGDEEVDQWARPTLTKVAPKDGFRNKNRLKWTSEQNIKYCIFLYQNIEVFGSQVLRKKKKVFSQLASYVGTRNTPQVKSHHQKMMKRHHQIQAIIDHMECKLSIKIETQLSQSCKRTREVQLQTEFLEEEGCSVAYRRPEGDNILIEEPELPMDAIGHYLSMPTWFDDI